MNVTRPRGARAKVKWPLLSVVASAPVSFSTTRALAPAKSGIPPIANATANLQQLIRAAVGAVGQPHARDPGEYQRAGNRYARIECERENIAQPRPNAVIEDLPQVGRIGAFSVGLRHPGLDRKRLLGHGTRGHLVWQSRVTRQGGEHPPEEAVLVLGRTRPNGDVVCRVDAHRRARAGGRAARTFAAHGPFGLSQIRVFANIEQEAIDGWAAETT